MKLTSYFLLQIAGFTLLGTSLFTVNARGEVLNGLNCKVTQVQNSLSGLPLSLGSLIIIDNRYVNHSGTSYYDSTYARIGNTNFNTLNGDEIRSVSPSIGNFYQNIWVLASKDLHGQILQVTYSQFNPTSGIHHGILSSARKSDNDVWTDYQSLAEVDCNYY